MALGWALRRRGDEIKEGEGIGGGGWRSGIEKRKSGEKEKERRGEEEKGKKKGGAIRKENFPNIKTTSVCAKTTTIRITEITSAVTLMAAATRLWMRTHTGKMTSRNKECMKSYNRN